LPRPVHLVLHDAQVLVAAATEVDDRQLVPQAGCLAQQPGQGVRGLERGDHAFDLGQQVEGGEGLGVAYGQSWNTGSFGLDAGNFKMKEKIWSLFGSMKWGGFYGTGVVSLSDIEFNDVRRKIVLGQVTRIASSRPEGSNGSASLSAGYDLRFGRFTVGPTLGVTTQNVTVNGFDESAEAGSAGLRLYEQKRRSEVGSFGVRASWDFGGFIPYAKWTTDKEYKNDERLVSATPLTLASSGNAYDMPAYAFDTSFTTLVVGVRGVVGDWLGYGINYSKVSGRSGLKEDAINGTVSIRF